MKHSSLKNILGKYFSSSDGLGVISVECAEGTIKSFVVTSAGCVERAMMLVVPLR